MYKRQCLLEPGVAVTVAAGLDSGQGGHAPLKACKLFAESGAIQPVLGIADRLEGDNKMFYSIYDNLSLIHI